MEMTAPHSSSPTTNCSPNMAKIKFSQHLDAIPFRSLNDQDPPCTFASSSIEYYKAQTI